MFLDENVLLEGKIPFPSKNSVNKEDFNNLTDNIRKTKDDIQKSEAIKFYSRYKIWINTIVGLIKDWVSFGSILGPAVIPFSLTISLLKLLIKKCMKYIKTEADKNMLVENLKIQITLLMNIKRNNKDNRIVEEKIDNCIDFINSTINILLK